MDIHQALDAWRAAERRWEETPGSEGRRERAMEVVRRWLDYQRLSGTVGPDELLIVADDERRFVAATEGLLGELKLTHEHLLEMRVDDLTPAESSDRVSALWDAFLREGWQEGPYTLALNDVVLRVHYQARAHHPIPGLHMSRFSREATK